MFKATKMVDCAIECVRVACPEPDFLEKHKSWLLTIVASLTAMLGVVFTYLLRSRCKKIACCGVSCIRQPVESNPSQIEVQHNPSGA